MFPIKQVSKESNYTFIQVDYKCMSFVFTSLSYARPVFLTFSLPQISVFQILPDKSSYPPPYSNCLCFGSSLQQAILHLQHFYYQVFLKNRSCQSPLLKNLFCFRTTYEKKFRHRNMAFKVSDNLLPIYLLSLIHLCLFNHPALE